MEKPSPRSPLTSSMTCGSELHVARPLSGSKLRDRWLFESGESAAGDTEVEASEPSDLAFTNRSPGGIRLCRLPPRIFCDRQTDRRDETRQRKVNYKTKKALLMRNPIPASGNERPVQSHVLFCCFYPRGEGRSILGGIDWP